MTSIRLSIPVNRLGAVVVSGPLEPVRVAVGVPALPDSIAWMLSSWILAFGLAFLRMGRAGVVEPTLVAVCAFGKLTFVLALVGAAVVGEGSWRAAAAAMPDLFLAVAFVAGLCGRTSG